MVGKGHLSPSDLTLEAECNREMSLITMGLTLYETTDSALAPSPLPIRTQSGPTVYSKYIKAKWKSEFHPKLNLEFSEHSIHSNKFR